jgi:hypothetical protein
MLLVESRKRVAARQTNPLRVDDVNIALLLLQDLNWKPRIRFGTNHQERAL